MVEVHPMTNAKCSNCGKTKAQLACGLCQITLCKNCSEFLEEGRVSFYKVPPNALSHLVYCKHCYVNQVEPELVIYDQLLEEARQVHVFNKDQSKETRLMKRLEKPISIQDCPDQAEAILRLAFFAAQIKHNAIIDVQLVPKKILDGRYQTTVWSGTGVPVKI
jgi:hypothetical protein